MCLTVLMVLTADAVHPLHEDAVCRHQLPPYDRARVPPCVHASVLPCRRGGPRCACCGCNRAAAGFQGGLCCGPLLWHLCGLQTVSAAPFFGAVPGEPPCLSTSHSLPFISFLIALQLHTHYLSLLWHLCGLQTVSAAPFFSAGPGEPPCLSTSHSLPFISFFIALQLHTHYLSLLWHLCGLQTVSAGKP